MIKKPPLRLALGCSAYTSISQVLTERLRVLEQLKAVTFSADRES